MNIDNLFLSYKNEPNPEHWRDFSELMWDLGFEMDCYNSAPTLHESRRLQHTEKEVQDQLLQEMITWSTQEVGNFIFSRYRELTHWSDYGYPEEKGHYFFKNAFPILEKKLSADWDIRNATPSLNEFTELVASQLVNLLKTKLSQDIRTFVFSEEGQFYIKQKYEDYSRQCNQGAITKPNFRWKCVTETAYYLEKLF